MTTSVNLSKKAKIVLEYISKLKDSKEDGFFHLPDSYLVICDLNFDTITDYDAALDELSEKGFICRDVESDDEAIVAFEFGIAVA